MANKHNTFQKAECGIDYGTEQSCLKQLANILLNAFSARDLEETVAKNPHWVAWREQPVEPPQSEAAR
ncbi:MAG: hypothetical protein IPJ68_04920 [Candidatus Moraniibacteriota bacterium]|nr:MAG: hypothetical protein IPJ68_04920 [Candidatus Moranbacteria bacterium]